MAETRKSRQEGAAANNSLSCMDYNMKFYEKPTRTGWFIIEFNREI